MLSKKFIKKGKRILILIGVLFLCYQISKAQVVLKDNQVCMQVQDYRKFRSIILQSDTLRLECDSIINYQTQQLSIKDSLLINSASKIALKDSIITQKDKTISNIGTEYKELEKDLNKEKSSILSNFKFWLGTVGGLVFGVLISN